MPLFVLKLAFGAVASHAAIMRDPWFADVSQTLAPSLLYSSQEYVP